MRSTASTALIATLSLSMLVACSDGADPPFGPDAGATDARVSVDGQCGPSLRPYGPACIPILDGCADDEVPVPGGGCKKVGVQECLGGWGIKGPPDWTCRPIGVKECEPEWGLSWGPDWKCESLGPPRQCEPGPTPFSAPVCQPVMPDRACSKGLMPVVGSLTCEPIQDCGDNLYGNYRDVQGAIYVHAGYEGRVSDGSLARPYRTIKEALSAAPAHAKILIGDGRYEEALVIEKPVQLLGRCPRRVELVLSKEGARVALEQIAALVGRQGIAVPVHVRGAGPVRLQGMAISSQTAGAVASGAGARLELLGCEVADCGSMGVAALDGAEITLRHSLLHRNAQLNLFAQDARVVVEDSALSDGRSFDDPDNGKMGGWGLYLLRNEGEPSATVRRSLILRNRGAGIIGVGADLEVEDSIIADTREHETAGLQGPGILLYCAGQRTTAGWTCDATIAPPTLALRRSLLTRNHWAAVYMVGVNATVERSVLRDTFEQVANGIALGALIALGGLHPERLDLVVQESLVARPRPHGIVAAGVHLRVRRTLLRDAQLMPDLDPYDGKGVAVWVYLGQEASLKLEESLISNHRAMGVEASGVDAVVERSVIVDTQPGYRGTLGAGLACNTREDFPASLTVRESLLARNNMMGLQANGCEVRAQRLVIRDTAPSANGWGGYGIVGEPAENFDSDGQPVFNEDGNIYLYERPSNVVLEDCKLENNRGAGLLLQHSSAEVTRTIVRGTRSQPMTFDNQNPWRLGAGILANGSDKSRRPEVTLREVLLAENATHGAAFTDFDATLRQVVARGARPPGGWGPVRGGGIHAVALSRSSRLVVEDCQIDDNWMMGFELWSMTAEIRRTVVRETAEAPYYEEDGSLVPDVVQWGDGIMVHDNRYIERDGELVELEDYIEGSLLLEDSLLQKNARMGIYAGWTRVKVQRCVFRQSRLPVYYDKSTPDLGESNVYEDNGQNEPATGLQIEPAPPPTQLGF